MRTVLMFPFSVSLLIGLVYTLLPGCSHVALSDEFNLRAKFVEFTKQENLKRWMIEDQVTANERAFQDGIRRKYRESQMKNQDQILDAPDWKQAKRDARDRQRNTANEQRQEIRIHREQFELQYLQIQKDQDGDLRAFLDPIEAEFKKNRQKEAYQKAESDFDSSRDDLREDLSRWKELIKAQKTTDTLLNP